LDFKDLITSEKQEVASTTEEARFSFIKGSHVEDHCAQGTSYALGPSIRHCVNKFCTLIALTVACSLSFIFA
jgi:hypothetical protein